jgi:predicted GTPase
MSTRIVILGAADRNFHNFNVVYRHDPGVHVVAFTQAQIPRLEARCCGRACRCSPSRPS